MFRGLIDDVKAAAANVVARIATRAAIGVVFLVAIGFAVAAITLHLVDRFGGITASWILAVGFAVIGVIGITAAKVHDNREQERKAEEERQAEAEGPSMAQATSQAAKQLPLALVGSLLTTTSGFVSPLTLLRFIGRNAALVAFGGILAVLLWPQRSAADDVMARPYEPAE